MKIDERRWTELRQAASADDQAHFRALVWSLVRQAIREDTEARQAGTAFLMDGRPYLASCR